MNEYKRQWMMVNSAIDQVKVLDPTGSERERSRYDIVVDNIRRQGFEIPVTFLAARASKLLSKSTRKGLARVGRVGARILPGVGYALLIQDIMDLYEFVTQD